jgi:uncharacterized membrane protein HdeD (DUF308 family)
MAPYAPSEIVRQASTWSILWGILLIVVGFLAMGSPLLAALTVSTFIAWLIVMAGVLHLIIAFHSHRAGSLIWKVLVGVAYVCFGLYLVSHPLLGVASLTFALAFLFLIEGVFELGLFFRMRTAKGSSWILIDGIITLLLGLMIYIQWPSSSMWAIGTLVGVSMLMSGVTRVMLSLAVRKSSTLASPPSSKLAA